MKLITLLLYLISFNCYATSVKQSFNFNYFKTIPILHEGRIKPLDTFSRTLLTSIHNKDHLENLTSIEWLAELLFNQHLAYQREIFHITNPDVLNAINLPKKQHKLYSFNEISSAIKNHLNIINKLQITDPKNLSLAQKQLISLYHKSLWYFDISRSLSMILPMIMIHDKNLAQQLNLPNNISLSYLQIIQHAPTLSNQENITQLNKNLALFSEDKKSNMLRIIPPIWHHDHDLWQSPWQVLVSGKGSPESAIYLNLLEKLAISYLSYNSKSWQKTTININERIYQISDSHTNYKLQKLEVLYNQLDLFHLSLILYLIACIFLTLSILIKKIILYKTALLSFTFAILFHLIGIIMRVIIMHRPPVSNLYESIIFVSLIAVIITLIMEIKKRDKISIFIGSVLGVILQFIASKYALEGDTMQILTAVLNTNFWLITHVITITIGYSVCLVVGTLGHYYLIKQLIHPYHRDSLQNTQHLIIHLALIALFFSLLGTILGGIWADQSWGRFWGWDPKENGAMLIVLWLILLLHANIAKIITPLMFAAAISLTNIIVALAWFGVNLLNIGLHSYGFTSNIAQNLGIFCLAEISFIVIMCYRIKYKY